MAKVNPQVYLPDVAMTSVNLSTLYLKSIPDQEKSLAMAKETLQCALPFADNLPAASNYIRAALKVVSAWGEDADAFLKEVIDEMKQKK